MTPFRFPLDRVLHLRRTQLEIEEAKFRDRASALAAVDRARAELEASAVRAEFDIRRWNPVDGAELAALRDFRVHVRAREQSLAAQRADCARQLAAQQAVMLEARRRCRLLERLRDRRLAEWRAAADKELETLASESALARFGRARAAPL